MKRKMTVAVSFVLSAYLLMALAAFSYPAYAQKSGTERNQKQPVPTQISIENADVTLVAKEDGFEAILPGIPARRLIKGDPSVEKPDVMQYDLHRVEDAYSIRFADYNFKVTDPAKLRLFYELVKQEYFNRARQEPGIAEAILVGEKDVLLDGNPGREFVVAWNKRVIWIRSFLIQRRLYQLIYSAARARKKTSVTVKAGETKALKFFNSFKVTKPPPPLNAHATNN